MSGRPLQAFWLGFCLCGSVFKYSGEYEKMCKWLALHILNLIGERMFHKQSTHVSVAHRRDHCNRYSCGPTKSSPYFFFLRGRGRSDFASSSFSVQPCALGSWVQPQPQQRFLRSLSAWIVSSGHSDTNSCASHLLRKWLVIQFWSMRNRKVFSGPCWESSLMLTRPDVWEHATILKPCSELAKVLRMAFLMFVIKTILNLRFGIYYLSNIYHGKKNTCVFCHLNIFKGTVQQC